MALLPTKTNKLHMQWRGPYTIVEKVGVVDYRIQLKGKEKLFHANMLKHYIERNNAEDVSDVSETVTGGVFETVCIAVIDIHDDK